MDRFIFQLSGQITNFVRHSSGLKTGFTCHGSDYADYDYVLHKVAASSATGYMAVKASRANTNIELWNLDCLISSCPISDERIRFGTEAGPLLVSNLSENKQVATGGKQRPSTSA